jgi:hypothetical protein
MYLRLDLNEQRIGPTWLPKRGKPMSFRDLHAGFRSDTFHIIGQVSRNISKLCRRCMQWCTSNATKSIRDRWRASKNVVRSQSHRMVLNPSPSLVSASWSNITTYTFRFRRRGMRHREVYHAGTNRKLWFSLSPGKMNRASGSHSNEVYLKNKDGIRICGSWNLVCKRTRLCVHRSTTTVDDAVLPTLTKCDFKWKV